MCPILVQFHLPSAKAHPGRGGKINGSRKRIGEDQRRAHGDAFAHEGNKGVLVAKKSPCISLVQ